MLNILIADDEVLERRAVKASITSNFKDTFNIYEVKNGREAIEVSEKIKPDILIMDIKMPGINGMEAIKEISSFLNDSYIIILSAYDYFSYVQEAMEYGVKEYLLKPLKKDEIITKLQKGIKFVKSNKEKRKNEIELKEKLHTMLPIIEDEMCFAIANNDIKSIDYTNFLQYLKMNFKLGFCMIISIENENNIKIKNYIKEYIKRFHTAISSCFFTQNIIMFIEISENKAQVYSRKDIISLATKLIETSKNKYNEDISVGIGRLYSGIENMSKSYAEAYASLYYKEYKNNVKYIEDIIEKSGIDSKFNEIVQNKISAGTKEQSIIKKSLKYIENRYNSEITLEEVASYVAVSPFYLSKLFKETTGKNYVDYITGLRMKKAKEMLDKREKSIKEICFAVGYNDPNYFSRVFKKVEGMSPSEYKSI